MGSLILHGMEDLLLNVIHRVEILAVPLLDSVAFLMSIANVNVALIFGLQILEKVILYSRTFLKGSDNMNSSKKYRNYRGQNSL